MLFDSTVIHALTYASETWALTKVHKNKINTIQAALERRLVERSGIKDMLVHINKSKYDWAGHLMRSDSRWSTALQLWIIPRDITRPVGRPPIR